MLLRRVTEHVKAQNWTAVALDFLIVVAGVYSAVWIEGIQGRQEQRQRTDQIIETLRSDLRGTEVFENAFAEIIQSNLRDWNEARARGELPPPVYFRTPGSDTPPQNTWDALLNMNLGAVLHPDLVFDLAFYYSEREGVGTKFIRYVTFVETELLPRLSEDSAVFYVDDRSRLKPQFKANMDRLQDWQIDSRRMVEWAKCLDERLATPDIIGATCVPDFARDEYSETLANTAKTRE